MTLAGMTYPAWRLCLLSAVRAGCLALLGHPWMALAWFAASGAADYGSQHLLGRWTREAETSPDEHTPWRMAGLAFARSAIYMSAPLAAALMTGGIAEVLFLAVIGGYSLVPVALSYGAFAPKVFWGFVLPPVAAFAIMALDHLQSTQALALTCALAATIWVLAVVSLTWRESLGGWRKTHDTSLQLIDDLQAARDRALEERAAADIAREAARVAGQARANFLATMSHEIRVPMNGVLGMAEALRRSAKEPDQAARLDMLVESGEHLLSILNDVLDMSKIDAGRLDLALEPEDLPRFLQLVVAFWTPQAEAKGLRLELVADPSLAHVVNMDAVRLRQVLYNLIGNALKYTDKGTVTVAARCGPARQGRVRTSITVSDTGRGIPPEAIPTLFDRYSLGGEAAAQRYGGTGLGLAICKQMTELMGGRIRVESSPAGGAAFHLDLVLELARTAVLEHGRKPTAAAGKVRALKILAVDDDTVNLAVVEQLLTGAKHQVFKAASAGEALRMAAAQAFDIILMDIHMPDMSGQAVLRALRAKAGPNQATPTIALTADVVSGGRQAYLAQGFAEHATKPIRVTELMDVIARSARPAAKRKAPAKRRA
jgi:signal transduction histidine kinase/ActR/RegA family two-component response regulator